MRNARAIVVWALIAGALSVGFRSKGSLGDYTFGQLGNMYLSDTLLLLSDNTYGVHVFSVRDASSPVHRLTIPIQGNTGLAMVGRYVFANSYSSIVTIELDGAGRYQVIDTVFGDQPMMVDYVDEGPSFFSCMSGPTGGVSDVAPSGSGGSYATFAVVDTLLYHVDQSTLVALSIGNPRSPYELSRTYLGWDIETLHPSGKYLFVGGQNGMYVLDRSIPSRPTHIGTLQHFRSCDPVVVRDTVAYVTLRGGNRCGETRDVLLAVSVAQPSAPRVLSETPLETPYGLAVRDSLLYVANGYSGFSLYSVRIPGVPHKDLSWGMPTAQDFIWDGKQLFVMGATQVSIMDVSEPSNPSMLSVLE